MPDASHHTPNPQHGHAPNDWQQAFAGLALETPDTTQWPRVAARLHDDVRATAPAVNQRTWLALAASIGLVAASGLWWWRTSAPVTAPAVADATITTPAIATVPMASDEPRTTLAPLTAATTHTARKAIVSTAPDQPREQIRPHRDAPQWQVASARRAKPSVAQAQLVSMAPSRQTETTPALQVVATATSNDFEPLYAASAQLESLLTLARDTRVESGPAAALSGALDAELASIDARLALPNLDGDQRYALWQARVEALQQITGLESQLRLLAADGQGFDGALVSID